MELWNTTSLSDILTAYPFLFFRFSKPMVTAGGCTHNPHAEAVPAEACQARLLGAGHPAVCGQQLGGSVWRARPGLPGSSQEGQQQRYTYHLHLVSRCWPRIIMPHNSMHSKSVHKFAHQVSTALLVQVHMACCMTSSLASTWLAISVMHTTCMCCKQHKLPRF